MQIILVVAEHRGGRLREQKRIPLKRRTTQSGTLQLIAGDYFKLELINTSDQKTYFSLLDIQPDNQLNVLLPNAYRTSAECIILPGDTLLLPELFQISPPLGHEYFKLIATTVPFDLAKAIDTRGAESPTPHHSALHRLIQILFPDSTQSQRSGFTTPIYVTDGSGRIDTYPFEIIAK